MAGSRILLIALASAGLGLGIYCGRLLRADSPTVLHASAPSSSVYPRAHDSGSIPTADEEGGIAGEEAQAEPAVDFVVPPEAMGRIQVDLLGGSSLNKEECRLLGMTEPQIKELELVVDDAVKRWREREKAAAKRIPSASGDILWHIPAADPALAEQEWQSLTKKVVEIGGPGLEPILKYRLIDGYSPSHQSNAGTGMLNILTAGFGTLNRFIRIPKDGREYPQIIDALPTRMGEVPVDESLFGKFGDTLNFEAQSYVNPKDAADYFSHLPPTK